MPDIDIDKAQTVAYWVVGTILGIGTAIASVFGLKKRTQIASDPATAIQVAIDMQMDNRIEKLRRELNEKGSDDHRRIYEVIADQNRDFKQEIAEVESAIKELVVQANENSKGIAILLDREERAFTIEQNKDREAGRPPRRRT